LRIGLEVSPLAINSTGIPNYIRRLLRGFASLDTGNRYLMYTNRPLPEDLDLPSNFHEVLVNRPLPRFQLWFQLALPGRLRKDGVDVFHGLFSRLPLRMPVPSVITSHDLSGYRMPGMHKKWTHMTNLIYPVYMRRADRIIAVSEFTAGEIGKYFPESSSKTRVVHEAAPPEYSRVTDRAALEELRGKYGLPERYVLFLGTLEPRKNLPRLLEAYISIMGEIDHSLVIAGGMGWKSRELLDSLASSGAGDRVRLTGFVEAEDVPGLMSLADMFVYPSLYEGFGLPILEAMACGTPVITSSVSSMPEVAGSAALLVNPLSVEEIGQALLRLAADVELRSELSSRGLEREAGFSWERAARETLAVYEELLAEAGE